MGISIEDNAMPSVADCRLWPLRESIEHHIDDCLIQTAVNMFQVFCLAISFLDVCNKPVQGLITLLNLHFFLFDGMIFTLTYSL